VRGGEACWKYEIGATEDIQYWIFLARQRMEERMGVKSDLCFIAYLDTSYYA
jgi:hypothetical protein